MSFKAHIAERFALNVARVHGLVRTFHSLHAEKPAERDTHDDLLRAAVVLLYATLEDLVRSLEELCFERPRKEHLGRLKFATKNGQDKDKLSLAELVARYPGKRVDDIVGEAIDAYLERLSYGNLKELKDGLERLSLPKDDVTHPYAADLAALMRRRHWIAHRVDVPSSNPNNELHLIGVRAIEPPMVESWTTAVERFGHQVLTQFKEPTP